MWDMFLDGAVMDGADLQHALEQSGLTEWHPASAGDAARCECEVGDPLLGLTGDGALRGVGIELRLHGCDPDRAANMDAFALAALKLLASVLEGDS